MAKKRLDVLLVERGLAESRAQAQALVLAGLVPGLSKAGEQVDEDAELAVAETARYVSRGGEKLANALDATGVDPSGLDCLDVGPQGLSLKRLLGRKALQGQSPYGDSP